MITRKVNMIVVQIIYQRIFILKPRINFSVLKGFLCSSQTQAIKLDFKTQRYKNIDFIYSVQKSCIDLTSENEIQEFQCQYYEADTIVLFIYYQIRSVANIDNDVVLDVEDTDVIVLAAYASYRTDSKLLLKRKHQL